MKNYFTVEQVGQLLRAVNPVRTRRTSGQTHMEAYEIRAHLNRVFGFGRWSADVTDMQMVGEVFRQKTGMRFNKQTKQQEEATWDVVTVVYRAGVRLEVKAPDGTALATYTEYAAGDAINFEYPANYGKAHDFALKTAESQALKRAATNLGDQFGLSLYNKGDVRALVKRTIVALGGVPTEGEAVDHDAEQVAPETIIDAEVITNEPDWKELFDRAMAERSNPDRRTALMRLGTQAKQQGADDFVLAAIHSEIEKLNGRKN